MRELTEKIVIEGKSIVKDFQLGDTRTRVLKSISLKVSQGEFVSIMGQSGSGKSTLLYILGGLDTPTSGAVFLNGIDISKLGDEKMSRIRRQNIGFVFQFYNLIPNLNVEENIMLPLLLDGKKMRDYKNELAEILEVVGLSDRRKHTPRELSGGQQQRAALARMLASEPDVLLFDEPFSALDAHLREQMQMQVLELLESYGKDAVLVTHSRDEAYRLCGELIVMDAGRPIAHGGTKELFRAPGLVQVARLTGCKNISRAKKEGAHRVEALDWGISLDTADPVPDDVSHVGVRAHLFFPPSDAYAPNLIAIENCGASEGPFEWNVLFRAAGAASEKIWWKIGKHAYAGVPDHLAVLPEDVLVLREG